jgi:AraC-like DNA-binding protein
MAVPEPRSDTPPIATRMSVRTLLPLAAWLRTRGVDLSALFLSIGVEVANLFARDVWVDRDKVLAAWRIATSLFPDEAVALRVLDLVDLRLLDVLQYESGFVVLQAFALSETVGAGLEMLVHYYSCTHGSSRLVWVHDARSNDRIAPASSPPPTTDARGSFVEIELNIPASDGECPAFVEFSLGLVVRLMQAVASAPPVLNEVRFTHPGPRLSTEYQNVFGAPVHFSSSRNSLVLPSAALAIPLRTRNPAMLERVKVTANELLAMHDTEKSLSVKVRRLLETSLVHGAPSAEFTARQLAMSVRHLSRRLAEEGTRHQTLLDEVRAALAAKHLTETDRPIDELPLALGYSDPSTFRRAFRRWFGCSPAELRARQRG